MIIELKGIALYLTAYTMLAGIEGREWCYYGKEDQYWWGIRLYLGRN